jgi:hypothetical protein
MSVLLESVISLHEAAAIWPVAKNLQHLLLTPEAGL